jgi:hypothetical protein
MCYAYLYLARTRREELVRAAGRARQAAEVRRLRPPRGMERRTVREQRTVTSPAGLR